MLTNQSVNIIGTYVHLMAGRCNLWRALNEGGDFIYGAVNTMADLIEDPRVKFFEAMRRYLDIPAFIYDMQQPRIDDPDCLDEAKAKRYVEYNTEQARSLVAFL